MPCKSIRQLPSGERAAVAFVPAPTFAGMTILAPMSALSALARRFDYSPRWRVGLLTLVVICAAGNSASGSGLSAGKRSSSSGSPPASGSPDAQAYVDAHNAVRAALQKPAGYSGPWTPLPPVTWSDELYRIFKIDPQEPPLVGVAIDARDRLVGLLLR